MSWTFSQLPLNAAGGGAQQQQTEKAVLLFLGLGCNLLQLLSLAPTPVPPGPATAQELLKPPRLIKEHQKVPNLEPRQRRGDRKQRGGGSRLLLPARSPACTLADIHLTFPSARFSPFTSPPWLSPQPSKASLTQTSPWFYPDAAHGGIPTRQCRKGLCAAWDNPGGW